MDTLTVPMLLAPRASEVLMPIGHVDVGARPIVITVVLLTLPWLLVGLRLLTRVHILKSFGWDDFAMVVSLIFFSVFQIAYLNICFLVNGKNSIWKSELIRSTSWLLVCETFYIITMLTLKISLAIFFLRILLRPWQRRVVYTAVTISTIFSTAYFFFAVFQCGVVRNSLDLFTRFSKEQCVSPASILGVSYTHAVITASTDWTFAVLPMVMIKTSRLEKKEKIIVGFIIAVGTMGSIASIIRFRYIPRLTTLSSHFYGDAIGLANVSSIELSLGISAGSLATFRPLLRKWISNVRGLRTSYGNPSRGMGDNERRSALTSRTAWTPPRQTQQNQHLGSPLSTDKLRDNKTIENVSPQTTHSFPPSVSHHSGAKSLYTPDTFPTSFPQARPATASSTTWTTPWRPIPTAPENRTSNECPLPTATHPSQTSFLPKPPGIHTPPRKRSIAAQLEPLDIPAPILSPRRTGFPRNVGGSGNTNAFAGDMPAPVLNYQRTAFPRYTSGGGNGNAFAHGDMPVPILSPSKNATPRHITGSGSPYAFAGGMPAPIQSPSKTSFPHYISGKGNAHALADAVPLPLFSSQRTEDDDYQIRYSKPGKKISRESVFIEGLSSGEESPPFVADGDGEHDWEGDIVSESRENSTSLSG
ncbi:hypothetical protein EJ08DRAFT_13952 [Tothia fuscella]|uniref:Rhodopsin domain-containing protein n=1 Tax=Tothia fuscella TaxID=1048955 RepID=A0A9P4P4C9_9PEZI|nr:hypothetical protein EJ08DRAFT_13952 [Tothia fuscella]